MTRSSIHKPSYIFSQAIAVWVCTRCRAIENWHQPVCTMCQARQDGPGQDRIKRWCCPDCEFIPPWETERCPECGFDRKTDKPPPRPEHRRRFRGYGW